MSKVPAVSVVIPTRNAPPVLRRTLACLAEQSLAPGSFEVIVVAGVAEEEVRRLAPARRPYELRVLNESGHGAARRRNAGAAAARADLLVFLDDDMAAETGLLAAHLASHLGSRGERVVMGYLPPNLSGARESSPPDWAEINLRNWWDEVFQEMERPDHRFVYSDLLSGNFSVSKSLFERVGGFNTTLLCREDFELGMRLLKAGASLRLCREAQSDHQDATDLKRSLQRKAAEGRADVQVARLHPGLGSTMLFAYAGELLTWPSQLLSAVAQRWPTLGNILVAVLLNIAAVLEFLDLKGLWLTVKSGLLMHFYWQGVLAEAHGEAELRSLSAPSILAETCVDLRQGPEEAIQALENQHPAGVLIALSGLPLGRIAAKAGAEGVRGDHLRAWLAGEGALVYASACSLLAALGVAEDEAPFVLSRRQDDITSRLGKLPLTQVLTPQEQADRLQPSAVIALELAEGLRGVRSLVGCSDRQQVLVRWLGRPIGWLHLVQQAEPRLEGDILYALLAQVGDKLLVDPALLGPILAPYAVESSSGNGGSAGPLLSIVVCTRDRTENLEGCLQALKRLDPLPQGGAVEIIVVDNASTGSRTAELAHAFGVRCIREERPGLDFARNCGLAAARAPLVAYVDDDARPAADWAAVLIAAFEQNGVAAVTGYVAPAELSTHAQCLFEWVYGGMGHGVERKYYRRDLLSATEFLQASACGVGTNMAFRRQVLLDLGGFDEALDVGGPAGGGGDVEIFHRLLARGCSLLYEPSAVVWHYHRREMAGLHRQLFDNGRSFGAYLLTCAANKTAPAHDLLLFVSVNWLGGWLLRRLIRPGPLPRSLVWAELRGALYSPVAYRRAIQRVKAI